VGCGLAALFTVHALMESLARWAEVRQNEYLWGQEEYLQLFTPTNYTGRGRGRILICGPSEAREDLLTDVFDRRFPGLHTYQSAHGAATLHDVTLQLAYMERVYGPSAAPDILVLGVSPRFVANISLVAPPFIEGMNKYSPYYRVDDSVDPPRLAPKSVWESLVARARLLLHQQPRYRAALDGAWRALRHPERMRDYSYRAGLTPAKYHFKKQWSAKMRQTRFLEPASHWPKTHSWDASAHRGEVIREMTQVRDYARRNGVRLYVVNMPEISWNRRLFDPERYQHYLGVLHEVFGDQFLDLRTLLHDEEFQDLVHATLAGSRMVSERVAGFVAGGLEPAPAVASSRRP